jgi:transmembrane sensor
MTRRPSDIDEKIAAEAAQFIVNGEESEPGDEQQLVGWLADSPQHVAEYMRMSALWDALADPRLEVKTPATGNALSRRAWWAAAAALLVLTFGVTWWASTRPKSYETVVGQVTSFPLADRSVVFLNADSRISVHYSDTQRRIILHSGEAVFEVAPDVERPFVVVCGATRVTAVGTKFAVGRRPGETTVTLIEGKVMVAGQLQVAPGGEDEPAVAQRRLGSPTTVALTPGQRLTMRDSGKASVATVDSNQVAPWRHRRLVFDSEPLSAVAADFNRFNKPQLRIESESLRDLRISGVFSANDPESLLAYLRTLDGVEVHVEAGGSATVRATR